MFYKKNADGYRELVPGVEMKTLAYGERTSFTEVTFKKGSIIPIHNHMHEQTGYLIKGKLLFNINGEEKIAEPGDSWNIASNVKHSAEALEDCVVIEVFSPVRQEYL